MKDSIKKGFGLAIGVFLADFVWHMGCKTVYKLITKNESVMKDQ